MSSAHRSISNDDRFVNSSNRTYQAEQRTAEIKARAEQREREIRSQYESSISSLTSQINSISSQHDADLKRLREEHNLSIVSQAKEFSWDINRLEQDMNRNFDDFRSRFTALANREADQKKRAEKYIIEFEDMLARVSALNPQKYNEGNYFGQMNEQLAITKNHYQNGDYQAVLAAAGVNFTNISALEQRLTLINNKFRESLAESRNMANKLQDNIAMLTEREPIQNFTHNGETISEPYDINYWTYGRFNDFCQNLNNIEQRLKTAENDSEMDLDQLEEIKEQLNLWTKDEGEVHLLDEEGKKNLTCSIAVGLMTTRIYKALEEQGWGMVDLVRHNDNDKDDPREPCNLLYKDGVGNSVAIIVAPSNNTEETSITFDVYVNGEDNANSEYARSIEEGIMETIDRLQGNKSGSTKPVYKNDCHLNPTPEALFKNVANAYREQRAHTQVKKEKK